MLQNLGHRAHDMKMNATMNATANATAVNATADPTAVNATADPTAVNVTQQTDKLGAMGDALGLDTSTAFSGMFAAM